jgi:hypothetical protein
MKILLLDIETAPNLVYSWGLWDQNIAINQIVKPGYILCWAAQWLDKREIMFDSIHDSLKLKMIKRIHKLINEADAVVHYNGVKFDMPWLNQEFLLNGLPPPSGYADIDLLRTARSRFNFPSNKLDYVAKQLDVGQKIKHIGMDLWTDCMNGCPKAWAKMKRYNKQDVRLLKKVYIELLPWVRNHPNWGVVSNTGELTCRNCGSENIKKDGIQRNQTLSYQRYRCKDCWTPLQSPKALEKRGCGVLK